MVENKYSIPHLDVICHPPSKMLNDESRLSVWRWHKEWIVQMLLLQLVQQGFVCGLREAEDTQREGQNININMWYLGQKTRLTQIKSFIGVLEKVKKKKKKQYTQFNSNCWYDEIIIHKTAVLLEHSLNDIKYEMIMCAVLNNKPHQHHKK